MNKKELEFTLELRKLNNSRQWEAYQSTNDTWNLGEPNLRGPHLFQKSKEEIINFVKEYK